VRVIFTVRSEFERESDSGTSEASDPARGDPCDEPLGGHSARDDPLYLTVRFTKTTLDMHSKRADIRLEGPKTMLTRPRCFAQHRLYIHLLPLQESAFSEGESR